MTVPTYHVDVAVDDSDELFYKFAPYWPFDVFILRLVIQVFLIFPRMVNDINLAIPSSAPSQEIRESGSAFQSLMVWGGKLHL